MAPPQPHHQEQQQQHRGSAAPVLLHGALDVHVEGAEHLPRTVATALGSFVRRFVCCGFGPALYGSVDPYAVLEVGGTRRLRTSVKAGDTSPRWDERFDVLVADEAAQLRMVIKVCACCAVCCLIPMTMCLQLICFYQTNKRPA